MNDPYIVTTERQIDRVLLQEMAKKTRINACNFIEEEKTETARGLYHSFEFKDIKEAENLISKLDEDINSLATLAPARDHDRWEMFGGSRTTMNQKEAFQSFLQRMGMACIGGLFVVGPMLIMVLHQSLITRLLTTSLCVFGFGLTTAAFLDRPFDVLSGTAAYAAVLVVFIGTSSGGS